MALPHPKQHPKCKVTPPEEIQVKATNHAENALFAFLGAVSALVVGLTLFGDLRSPLTSDRQPASAPTTLESTDSAVEQQYKPYGY